MSEPGLLLSRESGQCDSSRLVEVRLDLPSPSAVLVEATSSAASLHGSFPPSGPLCEAGAVSTAPREGVSGSFPGRLLCEVRRPWDGKLDVPSDTALADAMASSDSWGRLEESLEDSGGFPDSRALRYTGRAGGGSAPEGRTPPAFLVEDVTSVRSEPWQVVTAAHRKSQFCCESQVDKLLDVWGIGRCAMTTVTFEPPCYSMKTARKRMRWLERWVLPGMYAARCWSFERAANGSVHAHLGVAFLQNVDIRTGFDFESLEAAREEQKAHGGGRRGMTARFREKTQAYGRSASPFLRAHWKQWNAISKRKDRRGVSYGIGRVEVSPVKCVAGFKRYFPKYIAKSIGSRVEGDKGERLWGASGSLRNARIEVSESVAEGWGEVVWREVELPPGPDGKARVLKYWARLVNPASFPLLGERVAALVHQVNCKFSWAWGKGYVDRMKRRWLGEYLGVTEQEWAEISGLARGRGVRDSMKALPLGPARWCEAGGFEEVADLPDVVSWKQKVDGRRVGHGGNMDHEALRALAPFSLVDLYGAWTYPSWLEYNADHKSSEVPSGSRGIRVEGVKNPAALMAAQRLAWRVWEWRRSKRRLVQILSVGEWRRGRAFTGEGPTDWRSVDLQSAWEVDRPVSRRGPGSGRSPGGARYLAYVELGCKERSRCECVLRC